MQCFWALGLVPVLVADISGWQLCGGELHLERCRNLRFVLCARPPGRADVPRLTVYLETFFYNHTRRRRAVVPLSPRVPANHTQPPATYVGNFKPDYSFDNYTFRRGRDPPPGPGQGLRPVPLADIGLRALAAARGARAARFHTASCWPGQTRRGRVPGLGRGRHPTACGAPAGGAHATAGGGPSEQAHFFAALYNPEQIAGLVVLPFNATLRGYRLAARFAGLGLDGRGGVFNYTLAVHLVNYYCHASPRQDSSWFTSYWGGPDTLANTREGCSRRCTTYHWGGVSQEPLGAPYPINVWPHLNHAGALEQTALVPRRLRLITVSVPPQPVPPPPCSAVPPEALLAGLYRRPAAGPTEQPGKDVLYEFGELTPRELRWEPRSCSGGLPELSAHEILERLEHYRVRRLVAFGDSMSREAVEMMSDLVCPACGLSAEFNTVSVNLTSTSAVTFGFEPLHYGLDNNEVYLGQPQLYSRALLRGLGFSESTDPVVIAQELAAAPDISLLCPAMGYVPHTVTPEFWAQVGDALAVHLANRYLYHASPHKALYLYIEPVPWSRLDFNTPQRTRQLWQVPKGVGSKLFTHWKGPYQIMEQTGPLNYKIRDDRADLENCCDTGFKLQKSRLCKMFPPLPFCMADCDKVKWNHKKLEMMQSYRDYMERQMAAVDAAMGALKKQMERDAAGSSSSGFPQGL
eukprot:g38722.t1